MCGIIGYLSYDVVHADDLKQRLRAGIYSLRHRGPDQVGEYFAQNGAIGLGFSRLSIIDLSGHAAQPMPNESGSVHLIFNGEIYNYRELRAQLVDRGHQFRSQSDGEVLVHLYEDFGPTMLDYVDGMFAFAIYDAKRDELFAARDRFGQKPFYYANTRSGFYWASELRTLAMLLPERLTEDIQGFYHYVTFNCYPREHTPFREIRKLLPAHSLVVNRSLQQPQTSRYYHLGAGICEQGPAERSERIRELFTQAVKKRLMSDVPLGFYLSGGIDSSSMVLTAAQHHEPVHTFTISIAGDPVEADETGYARVVAEKCHTTHHEVVFSEKEFAQRILKTAWALDEPVTLPDAAMLDCMTAAARDLGMVVMMSGEGGDETFFGYPHYWTQALKYYAKPLLYQAGSRGVRDHLKSILWSISPTSFGRVQRVLRGRFHYFGENVVLDDVEKHRKLAEQVLRHPDVVQRSEELFVNLQPQARLDSSLHLAKQLMLHDFNIRLPDLIMMKIDKITMANSVEARNPFLDKQLVEYAMQLPVSDLYAEGAGKFAFRRAFDDLLPEAIRSRRKVGFGASIEGRPKREFTRLHQQIIRDHSFVREYYASSFLEKLTRADSSLSYGDRYSAWNVAMFVLWKSNMDKLLATKRVIL